MPEPSVDSCEIPGLSPEQYPRHIAIIMDGNGRWAKARNLPRIKGHEKGAKTVRTIITHCARLGIEALTLYSFSTENWKRPKNEVDFLMDLYVQYLIAERDTIMDNNVKFLHIGQREGLPRNVLDQMDRMVAMSRDNTGLKLSLALNYGSRDEIVDTVQKLAEEVRNGKLDPKDIDESMISNSLYTASLPDPDLLIRTANERRVSNFLLWQISYAELYVCDQLWPDFDVEALNLAIKDFATRDRRFGNIDLGATGPDTSEPASV